MEINIINSAEKKVVANQESFYPVIVGCPQYHNELYHNMQLTHLMQQAMQMMGSHCAEKENTIKKGKHEKCMILRQFLHSHLYYAQPIKKWSIAGVQYKLLAFREIDRDTTQNDNFPNKDKMALQLFDFLMDKYIDDQLSKFIVNFIFFHCKQFDPRRQQVWCSDIGRKNFLVRTKYIDSKVKWSDDKKGFIFVKFIVKPCLKTIVVCFKKLIETFLDQLHQKVADTIRSMLHMDNMHFDKLLGRNELSNKELTIVRFIACIGKICKFVKSEHTLNKILSHLATHLHMGPENYEDVLEQIEDVYPMHPSSQPTNFENFIPESTDIYSPDDYSHLDMQYVEAWLNRLDPQAE